MQDIPLSELSQMMSQIPLENIHAFNNGLPTTHFGTLPKHLTRNHFIHDQRTQKVYSIPESYLQSAVPITNQWSQNAYQQLQNELDLKHQVNNFLLTNQWAGDMSRGPHNQHNQYHPHHNIQYHWQYANNSGCSPRWSPNLNDIDNSISSNSHSHSGNSDQWYPNDNDDNNEQQLNEHTQDDKQKHSNDGAGSGAGAWVTFNQL